MYMLHGRRVLKIMKSEYMLVRHIFKSKWDPISSIMPPEIIPMSGFPYSCSGFLQHLLLTLTLHTLPVFFRIIFIFTHIYRHCLSYLHNHLFWAEPVLQFCRRENMRDTKKDIAFLLVWDKDSYTERLLVLLPCTCVLQPGLIHLY
jgi:hypothetical protein